MNWMEVLSKTYNKCASHEIGFEHRNDAGKLLYILTPISHTSINANIEITIDINGQFIRSHVIINDTATILPATESAATRSSNVSPLSLGDKLQYLVPENEYLKYGKKKSGHQIYFNRIQRWAESEYATPHVKAVYKYTEKRNILSDLINDNTLHYNDITEKFPTKWYGDIESTPMIYNTLQNNMEQLDCVIRYVVQIDGKSVQLWNCFDVLDSWHEYYYNNKRLEDNADIGKAKKIKTNIGFCHVTGEQTICAMKHPAKIRHAGDKAKLISGNDTSGFTFKGRHFSRAEQAFSVSYLISQKAHNMLRFLISKQGFKFNETCFVAFNPNGNEIQNPWKTSSIFDDTDENIIDTGEHISKSIRKSFLGFKSDDIDNEDIIIMGFKSQTTGRLAIICYQKLSGSEFVSMMESWNINCGWFQSYSKDNKFFGAPSLYDIAIMGYGKDKSTITAAAIETLLPCIMYKSIIPYHILDTIINKAFKRDQLEHWEWEKILGIVCGLYRYNHPDQNYKITLERDRTSRDYLYGRLFATADCLIACSLKQKHFYRSTNATRLMAAFSENPYTIWLKILDEMSPYKKNLKDLANKYIEEFESIMCIFQNDDFKNDTKLSGEFFIAYYTQKNELMTPKN